MKYSPICAVIAVCLLVSASLHALPEDAPISPAQAVSMLQEGLVIEWKHDENSGLAKFDPKQVQDVRKAGFHHVRIRNHWRDQTEELPLDQPFDEELLQDLEEIVDSALAQGLGAVIAFRGPGPMSEEPEAPIDTESTRRYVRFWGMIAERFKDKSHRLFFNLFIEPGSLKGRNGGVYSALTREIRKTNPTRIVVYYKTPAPQLNEDGSKVDKKSPAIPGPTYYAPSKGVLPEEAGRYFIWDYHVLKHDLVACQWKVKQAWQYQQHVKEVMWSGAWSRLVGGAGGKEDWKNDLAASGIAQAFRDCGMSSSILCCGSNTFYFRDERRFKSPELVDCLTGGPSIWWNMLMNPGFDQETEHWRSPVTNTTTAGGIGQSPHLVLDLPNGEREISQDITMALNKNGPETYDVLGSFLGGEDTRTQFVVRVDGREFSSDPETLVEGKWHDIRTGIPVHWTGSITKAEFVVRCSGPSGARLGVDKLGLTQFYRKPVLDLACWPGERDMPYNPLPPDKKKASSSLGIAHRAALQIEAGNKEFAAIDGEIRRLDAQIVEIIKTIYPQYKLPHSSNPKQLQLQVENRKRKHQKTRALLDQIGDLERRYRDSFLIHDKKYREEFVKVYGGLPPSLAGVELLDVEFGGMEEARKSLKEKRKDEKRGRKKGPKLESIEARLVRVSKDRVVVEGKKEERSYAITPDTRFLNYDGDEVAFGKVSSFKTVRVIIDKGSPETAVSIQDISFTRVRKPGKSDPPGKGKDKKKRKDKNTGLGRTSVAPMKLGSSHGGRPCGVRWQRWPTAATTPLSRRVDSLPDRTPRESGVAVSRSPAPPPPHSTCLSVARTDRDLSTVSVP